MGRKLSIYIIQEMCVRVFVCVSACGPDFPGRGPPSRRHVIVRIVVVCLGFRAERDQGLIRICVGLD